MPPHRRVRRWSTPFTALVCLLAWTAACGGSDATLSLNGAAVVSGSTVHFEQATDTFVRDLTFTMNGTSLEATNQSAGGATFTVVLTRQ